MLLLMHLRADLVGQLFQQKLRPVHVVAALGAMLLYELVTWVHVKGRSAPVEVYQLA